METIKEKVKCGFYTPYPHIINPTTPSAVGEFFSIDEVSDCMIINPIYRRRYYPQET